MPDSLESPRALHKTVSIKHFDLRTRPGRAMPGLSASNVPPRLPAMNSCRRNGFPLRTRVRTPDVVVSRRDAADDAKKPGCPCGSYHIRPCFPPVRIAIVDPGLSWPTWRDVSATSSPASVALLRGLCFRLRRGVPVSRRRPSRALRAEGAPMPCFLGGVRTRRQCAHVRVCGSPGSATPRSHPALRSEWPLARLLGSHPPQLQPPGEPRPPDRRHCGCVIQRAVRRYSDRS